MATYIEREMKVYYDTQVFRITTLKLYLIYV